MRDANWKDRIMFFLGRLEAYRVEGDSMLPTLKDGDTVLILPKARVAVTDLVLAKHPYKQSVRMLKRVDKIDGERVSLIGDNPSESTDSRSFGTLSSSDILGKVICRLK